MTTEFVDELPPKPEQRRSKSVNARTGRLVKFAAELQANPGRWAKYPHTLNGAQSRQTCASHIRRGRLSMFTEGEFEAAVRGDVVYVRAVP